MNLGTRGTGDEEIQEMNQQQLQLLELAKEFYDSKPLYGETTFEMFLKNCPDALTHLFDLPSSDIIPNASLFHSLSKEIWTIYMRFAAI